MKTKKALQNKRTINESTISLKGIGRRDYLKKAATATPPQCHSLREVHNKQ